MIGGMSAALTHIAERVRERVRREGIELDVENASRYVHDEVRRYSERALGGSVPLLVDEVDAARQVLARQCPPGVSSGET